jgi:glycosidase
VHRQLDYIQGLGTTAIWLAPVFTNRPVQGEGANASAGYHGYWITDFTQVDPHFGTSADMQKLVDKAHQRGIKVYLDIITNHTADVIRYAQNQYDYRNKTDYPYRDAQGRPFDDPQLQRRHQGLPGRQPELISVLPGVESAADAKVKVPAWLNDPTMYHNRGDSTFSGENSEYGDFFGLDDLWTERPEVVKGMTKIYQDWIGKTGVDGFRIDTTKHVDMDFWPQFTAGYQQLRGGARQAELLHVRRGVQRRPGVHLDLRAQGTLPATLDFPFQDAANAYVAGGASAQRMAGVYAADDLYTTKSSSARVAADLPRQPRHGPHRHVHTATAWPGPMRTNSSVARSWPQLMFLTRGQPVVYSGDEQGFTGPAATRTPGRTCSPRARPTTSTTTCSAPTARTRRTTTIRATRSTARSRRWPRCARRTMRCATGVQVTATPPTARACSRSPASTRVSRSSTWWRSTTRPRRRRSRLPTYSAGMTFEGVYPAGVPLLSTGARQDLDGHRAAAVVGRGQGPRKLARPTAAPQVRITSPPPGPRSRRAPTVVADVPGDGLNSVSFAVRVGDGPWKPLGTATRAPYRVYHDLDGWPPERSSTYKAAVRDSAGGWRRPRRRRRWARRRPSGSASTPSCTTKRPAGDYSPGASTRGATSTRRGRPSGPTASRSPARTPTAASPGSSSSLVRASVGLHLATANGVKDVAVDRFLDPSRTAGGLAQTGQRDRVRLRRRPPPPRVVTVHYGRPDQAYWRLGLHLWGDGWRRPRAPMDLTAPARTGGLLRRVLNVPVGDVNAPFNFIVHNGDNRTPTPT